MGAFPDHRHGAFGFALRESAARESASSAGVLALACAGSVDMLGVGSKLLQESRHVDFLWQHIVHQMLNTARSASFWGIGVDDILGIAKLCKAA